MIYLIVLVILGVVLFPDLWEYYSEYYGRR